MKLLDSSQFSSVLCRYGDYNPFHPLIGAVLEQLQHGYVYESPAYKGLYFVVHKFGFCQFVQTCANLDYCQDVIVGITKLCSVDVPKLRLYWHGNKLRGQELKTRDYQVLIASRSKFEFYKPSNNNTVERDYLLHHPDKRTAKMASNQLGLSLGSRFWNTFQSFIENANAVLATKNNNILGVCYSAASSQGLAEIDVFVNPRHRQMGVALDCCSVFIERCLENGIIPHWDCYTNNEGSIALASRLGFKVQLTYQMVTISELK